MNLVFLAAVAVVLAVLFGWRAAARGGAGRYAQLQYGADNTIEMIPLDTDATYDIDTGSYTIHLRVEDGTLAAHVIGGGVPQGICGSGVVDAVASLLELELLDETGYLEDDPAVLCGAVSLTQKDVRMIQLAKSAVCAGMRTLAHHAGLRWDEVAELIVAGGFGSYLNLESAGKIGLIPEEMTGRTRTVGNASLDGAAMLLLDTALRNESEKMALAAETVDLSTDPVFMESYTEGMFF